MSILNVNQIQPVGGGNTITVSASDVNFSGNISVGSNFIGIVTASTATVATNAQGLTGTPDITVNNIQSGVVTATTFIGDGSGLTGVTASGSGINIKDSGSTVGVAATVDFGTNLNVSPASAGIVTVTVGDTDFEIVDKIVHTGDTDTAIRFPAADTITAETAGSERFRITSGGNVGIGTDNPGTTLDARGNVQFGDGGGFDMNILGTRHQFSINGSEKLRITSGGELQIANGNLKFSTAGTGIDFSATGNGSGTMTSELLDDYEEGTWTPIFDTSISGGTLSGITYDQQSGKYRKIGSMVYIEGELRTTAVTNGGAGTYDISGLPFTASVDGVNGTFFCYSQHSWTNAPHHFGVVANTDHARGRGGISVGDATYTNGTTNDFNTGSGSKNRVYFAGWYTTV